MPPVPFLQPDTFQQEQKNTECSLLHTGALTGCWNTLAYLTEYNIEMYKDVNSLDILGETPLSYALRGNTTIERLDTYMSVYALLLMGADVNRVGPHRLSPLMLAILMNDIHLVDILLRHNADINYRYSVENDSLLIPNKSTALSLACSTLCGNSAIVEILLLHRSSIHPHILFHAVQKASKDMKSLLLNSV